MLTALAGLARTLAELRAAQTRGLQAAARLAGVASTIDYGETVSQLAVTEFPRQPQAARPAPAAGPGPRRRGGPVIPPEPPRRPRRGT